MEKITKIILHTKKHVNIAIIGKYVDLKDAYKSLDEALTHGGIDNKVKVNLVRIDSEKLKISEIKTKPTQHSVKEFKLIHILQNA